MAESAGKAAIVPAVGADDLSRRAVFLVTAATEFEMEPFRRACLPARSPELVTGVGPVEAAVRLTAFLAATSLPLTGVINFGVAGAYVGMQSGPNRQGAAVLDICLAEREVLADLGICANDDVRPLRGEGFTMADSFELDPALRLRAESLLAAAAIPWIGGVFATVSSASGTRRRGDALAARHRALCENMEGAAVARACQHFDLPLLELRCISNLVEDRDLRNWQLHQACASCGEVTALVVKGLYHE
ncbi:MAG: futalosine hydrolase [Desulfobulbus sp.]|uniref:futalosine hydrolase n=1 Tax=Desulfobulbus sp. TaxID=895 RepID=UPI00283E7BA3|nr:futalosine hydrolase [Desulfobulbus sp.]MDR2550706.1 futalosine hydrolase [Desulfobulbus sp.]